jgi:hypothetical protein
MEWFITIHNQTRAHILSQINSLHIHFFKHIEDTASPHLHTFLWISSTCKSIYALPTTLYGEDTQNGTNIPGPWSRITSGVAAAANMWRHSKKSSADANSLRDECMVHLMQNEGSVPWHG